jgi:hypothetical protein
MNRQPSRRPSKPSRRLAGRTADRCECPRCRPPAPVGVVLDALMIRLTLRRIIRPPGPLMEADRAH